MNESEGLRDTKFEEIDRGLCNLEDACRELEVFLAKLTGGPQVSEREENKAISRSFNSVYGSITERCDRSAARIREVEEGFHSLLI